MSQHLDLSEFSQDDFGDGLGKQLDTDLKEVRTGGGVPVSFLDPGNFSFRIYPDRNEEGKPRILKRVSIHSFQLGEKRIRFWHDNRVNELVRRAEEAGDKDEAWKWRAREHSYLMTHLYRVPPGNKYLKKDTACALILNRKQSESFLKFVLGLSPEERKARLNPNAAAPAITLRVVGRGKSGETHFGYTQEEFSLPFPPNLPEGSSWEGLDKVYVQPTDRISDQDFGLFQRQVEARVSFLSNRGVERPNGRTSVPVGSGGRTGASNGQSNGASNGADLSDFGEEGGSGDGDGESDSPSPPSEGATTSGDEEKCLIAARALIDQSLREKFPEARFGKHPTGPTNPYCISCDHELDCRKLTESGETAS